MKTESLPLFAATRPAPTQRTTIVFDGGSKGSGFQPGLGNGYGSYQIANDPIVRVDHEAVMTANCAEVLTLCCALEELAKRIDPATVAVHVEGDSQIALSALKLARGVQRKTRTGKVKKSQTPKGSDGYRAACERLADAAAPFSQFTAKWKGRENSVAIFGH